MTLHEKKIKAFEEYKAAKAAYLAACKPEWMQVGYLEKNRPEEFIRFCEAERNCKKLGVRI